MMAGSIDEKELFQEVIALPRTQREAYLREKCDDESLIARVQQLIRDHEVAGDAFLADVVRGSGKNLEPLPIPTKLGQFKLLHPIGHGGMGVVYLAEDLSLGRRVAVKLLASHLAVSENDKARFRNEAKIVARLSHPGIVPVYSFGETDGYLYIVCELVEGESLDKKLEHFADASKSKPSRIQNRKAAQIAARVAEALEYAHRSDVIHRDVKPANILLAEDGTPQLTDFGIAKLLTEDQQFTSSGAGTVQYMSPEQIAASESTVDHRTDIFSLGVVLYEMLTGRLPFDGASREQVLEAIRGTEPRAPRSIAPQTPKDLQTICLKALQKTPKERYQTAAHMAADLRSYLAGDPILARPQSPLNVAWRRVYTRRRALGVIAVAAGSVAITSWWQIRRHDRRPRLRISGLTPSMSVSVLEFDKETQRFVVSEDISVTSGSQRMATGQYRFVLYDSAGFCEMSRTLLEDQVVELIPRILPTASVTKDMVLIQSGVNSGFPSPSSGGDPYFVMARDLDAFWIDKTEVSNAEYERFVDATGYPIPPMWGPDGSAYGPSWDPLPVVNISFRNAQAYAEWMGKRLPTALEWKRAARGNSGRLFPWGNEGVDDPDLVRARANAWSDSPDSHSPWLGSDELRESYLNSVWPVADTNHEDICDGVLIHMFGNVQEWTESPADPTKYGLPEDPLTRQLCGATWGDPQGRRWTLRSTGYTQIDAKIVGRGFRCAKSFSN